MQTDYKELIKKVKFSLNSDRLLYFILVLQFVISILITSRIQFTLDDLFNIQIVRLFLEKGQVVMFSPYQGINFLLIPFITLIGKNLFALRIADSLFLVLANYFLFRFISEYYEKPTAYLTIFILGLFPYYITMTNSEVPFLPFIATILMFLINRFNITENRKYILWMGIFLGFGIFLKLTTLYFILSLFLVFLLSNEKKHWLKIRGKTVISFFVLFLIAISPLMYYNLTCSEKFATVKLILNNFYNTDIGHSNINIIENIKTRILHLDLMLSEKSWLMEHKLSSLNFYIFLISLAGLILFKRRKDLFLLIGLPLFFVFSLFVPHMMLPIQFFMIFPFLALTISRFIYLTYRRFPKFLWVILIVLLFFIVINSNGLVHIHHVSGMERFYEDNYPQSSPAHYRVIETLANYSGEVYVGIPLVQYYLDALEDNPSLTYEFLCKLPTNGIYSQMVADCEGEEEILKRSIKETTGEEVYLIFPSIERVQTGNIQIYDLFCDNPRTDITFCMVPLRIFNLTMYTNNLTYARVFQIKDSANYPVYDIYRVD